MTASLQNKSSIVASPTGIWQSEEDTQVTITVSLSPFLGISKFHSSSLNPSNLAISLRSLNYESTTDGVLIDFSLQVKFPPLFLPPDTSLGE